MQQRSSLKRSSEHRDPFGEEGDQEEEPGFHEEDRLYGPGFTDQQAQIREDCSNRGFIDTKATLEKILAEASLAASTPSGSSDEAMGLDEDDEEDVDDAEHAETTAEAESGDAAGQESLKEDGPLQEARIRVNKLRIEVDSADDKIAANVGGAALFTGFLHKNRDRKKGELATSEKELADLQRQADHLKKTQLEAEQAVKIAQERQKSLLEAQKQAADADGAAAVLQKLAEHAQQPK